MPDLFKRTESTGLDQEAAPAYDDVIHPHGPANGFAHSSSASGYAALPQTDIEHDAAIYNHTPPSPGLQSQETLVQPISGASDPKSHVHCEECDRQAERRARRESNLQCCSMVALVFMVLFLCGMVLGIVIAATAARRARLLHG